MAAVKWIKIVTDIFDDEKILLIESLPSADSIIVIWFKLLCLAGKNNNSGVFLLNDRIAYTDEMLATIFRRDINTVRMALKTFEMYGMIETINNTIVIPNWSKHQTLDQLEERKEYMKNYMKKYREKQKTLVGGNKVPPNGLPIKEWNDTLKYFKYKCAYCGDGDSELEQDHIIPVKKGGLYTKNNIVPACRRCNSSKQDFDMEIWYRSQEFFDENRLNLVKTLCKVNALNLRKVNVNSLDKEEEKEEEKEIDIYINIYSSIINYLNEKANTKYRPSSSKTKTLIKARLNEGFVEDDFKTVIDNKTSEWIHTDMEKYLRPETLFGTKFESYLNQKIGGNINDRNSSTRQNTKADTGRFDNFTPTTGQAYELTEEERKRAEELI